MAAWDDPVSHIRKLEAQVHRVRAAIDRELASGCDYRHQQGEADECNGCTAARIVEALDQR